MENESTSTWAFLNESGEIVNVESDPGSSSESSIEFIHDDIVFYERKDNRKSSLQPEVQEDSQDVVENSSLVSGFENAVFEGATAAADGSSIKEGEGGEKSRGEFTLENITSANNNVSVSPNSTSPVSPSSSDDSSGSVTLLEGRFSDGDSDFELLDQHSSSDLAHLQLAAGVSNALPAAHRPKFNFKFKKQALGTSETASVNASDADDESSNNLELSSSPEESPIAPVDEIPPVTNLGSLAPVPPYLPLPSLVFKRPRMSVTFLMLASLVIGLLFGFTTKYSLGPYSSEQLSEEIDEIQRINEIHLLREENKHMHKYVDSLKWRMNNLQNSNKLQLLDELQQVNQLLKGRLDELRQQLDQLVVRREILEAKTGVQPPMVSDIKNQDLPADDLQAPNEPASENDSELQTELPNLVSAASHDDIIQIHSSPEELAPEENFDVSFNQGNTEQMSGSGASLAQTHQNDVSISSDEIIKSENKADDTIAVVQMKMEEEKRQPDKVELKQLVDSCKPATDSSLLIASPTIESVQRNEAEKTKESASYCSSLDKDSSVSMDWLNQDAMLQLFKYVISEIPPQAQQWKEYMSQKFQSMLDPDKELKVELETNSNFQSKKLNAYMNRMLDQMNRAKEDLQNKFEKTLHKIKKGTSKFWEKTASENEKEKSKGRKKNQELVDIRDNEAKHRSSQDSSLQLTDENNNFDDTTEVKKGLKVETKQNKHNRDKKIKSLRSKEGKERQHHRSDNSKKHRPCKSNHKEKKEQPPKLENEDKHDSDLKQLVDRREPATDSSVLLDSPTIESVQREKAKNAKESASYCSSVDEDCSVSMDWLNQDAMLQLFKSVISEIPPQAQQWKEYMSQKFQSMLDPDKELKVEPETNSNFQFEKLNAYMNRMLDQMNSAKEDLQNKFEKTLHKIKKGTSKFWEKTASENEKEIKFEKSKGRKKNQELVDNKAKYRSSQDSSLQLTDENNNFDDTTDVKKEYKINQKIEVFRPHQKGLKVETKQNKHNRDKKIKSFKFKKGKRSDDDKKQKPHKSNYKNKKYQTQESDDDGMKKQVYKSAKNKKNLRHKSDNGKKHFRKHKSQNKDERIIDKRIFNAKSASHERNKRKAKSPIYQMNLNKKVHRKYKDDPEMKAQSKDSCDQLAVKLEDSISTISKEKFRRMKLHTIMRLSKKLSNFNKQCKHFSTRLVKEWSACQQMWWTLCGRGFLPGSLQNSKCQPYLLAWQMSAAASPDGGGKPGCDDCGCQKKAVKQSDSLDLSEEDQQNATDSDSASGNVKEEKKVMSGEWYFRHKSVPAENKAQDFVEDEFESISEDLWDDLENDRLQHLDQMMNAEFHRFNHHNHVHRRRCKDHIKPDLPCYRGLHTINEGIKWASVHYQNLMDLIQNWQKQHI